MAQYHPPLPDCSSSREHLETADICTSSSQLDPNSSGSPGSWQVSAPSVTFSTYGDWRGQLWPENQSHCLTAATNPRTVSKTQGWDFPGGAVVKNPPANVGDTGSSPITHNY